MFGTIDTLSATVMSGVWTALLLNLTSSAIEQFLNVMSLILHLIVNLILCDISIESYMGVELLSTWLNENKVVWNHAFSRSVGREIAPRPNSWYIVHLWKLPYIGLAATYK